jgi:hypothetical protein
MRHEDEALRHGHRLAGRPGPRYAPDPPTKEGFMDPARPYLRAERSR